MTRTEKASEYVPNQHDSAVYYTIGTTGEQKVLVINEERKMYGGCNVISEKEFIQALAKKYGIDVDQEDLTFVGQSQEDRNDYDATMREMKEKER